MLRDAADDAYRLLCRERQSELVRIFCQGPIACRTHSSAKMNIMLHVDAESAHDLTCVLK